MQQSVQFDGQLLRELRKANDWSQTELSLRSGVSVSHISQLEKGTRKSPSLDMAYRLSEALSVSMYRFIRATISSNRSPSSAYDRDEPASTVERDPLKIAEDLKSWERSLRPDVINFILSDQAEEYLVLAQRLYEERNDPKQVLHLVNDFIQNLEPQNND